MGRVSCHSNVNFMISFSCHFQFWLRTSESNSSKINGEHEVYTQNPSLKGHVERVSDATDPGLDPSKAWKFMHQMRLRIWDQYGISISTF